MLKNGQTYFHNLAVFTPEDFCPFFFVKYVWPFFNIMSEMVIRHRKKIMNFMPSVEDFETSKRQETIVKKKQIILKVIQTYNSKGPKISREW